MDLSYIRMTGKELEKIKSVSALNAAHFAKELGISRSSLYVLFEQNAIPEEVERAGGVYLIFRDFHSFMLWYKGFVESII